MHLRHVLSLFVLVLITVALAAACGGGGGADEENSAGGGKAEVKVELSEWAVRPSVETVAPGEVTFKIENKGTTLHNLLVVKTDLAPDALPVDAGNNTVDESQLDVVFNTNTLDAGDEEERVVTLEPGAYVLLCNVPTHYQTGMRVGLRVE